MCISIGEIGLGSDVQAVYKNKIADNYRYEALPKHKMFHNFFTLDKDDIRFVIGSDKNNGVSMMAYTKSVDKAEIDGIYILYLELFFKSKYTPMPEHIKKSMSTDTDVKLLNGATDSNGDMVILGTIPDPKDEFKTVWMAIVLSPSRLGYRVPSRERYSSTPHGESCRSMDLWEMIGTAGTVAGLFSLFS